MTRVGDVHLPKQDSRIINIKEGTHTLIHILAVNKK
jgi:hypothetical protein